MVEVGVAIVGMEETGDGTKEEIGGVVGTGEGRDPCLVIKPAGVHTTRRED